MREAIERMFAHGGPEALSPEAEFQLRHADYVMEMPQSRERIRGRDAMRAMQEAFPTPPTITLRRVVGSGTVWVIEGTNDYAGDVWHAVLILELDHDGRIVRDTRYLHPGIGGTGMAIGLGGANLSVVDFFASRSIARVRVM
jgi:hypothetical protein